VASLERDGTTARALLAGAGLGGLLSMANVYMGLKTGWWDAGCITAAVVGFALVAPGAHLRGRPYTMAENGSTLIVAMSAAIMPPALGLLGAVPALQLLGHHPALLAVAAWGLALSVFGVLLALPLRSRLVTGAELPFPTARATVEVVRAIHSTSGRALTETRVLLLAGAVAALVTWFRDGRPSLVPGTLWWPWAIGGLGAASLQVGLTVSPLLLGAGILVGPRTGFSLLVGALAAWVVLAPRLVGAGVCTAEYGSLVGWLMWPGVGLMAVGGLAGLSRGFGGRGRSSAGWAAWAAIAVAAAAAVIASRLVFQVPLWLGLGSAAAAVVLIEVCVRTMAETDMIPLGSLGPLVQLLAAFVAPGPAAVNVACASFTAGAGAQTCLTTVGFKIGDDLGASRRAQLLAQLLGVLVGAAVALPAYALLTSAHPLGSPALPAPSAAGWQAVAALAERGAQAIPRGALLGCGLGALAGLACMLLERLRPRWWWVPSPVPLGVAFLVPAATGLAMGAGALLWLLISRRVRRAEPLGPSLAAGIIAGESLVGLVVSLLLATGVFS
jgi:uncharacterized oligopeptide transporter (OPT) family protein